MKSQIEVKVESRTKEIAASKLRRDKKIPGVVYSPKVGNLPFMVDLATLNKYWGHDFENTIFTLKSAEKSLDNLKVLYKDKSTHPLTRMPLHVDFYAVDMTKPVRVNVEIKFSGKAAGLSEGGMFQAIRRDIEVEVLPDKIPDFIEVDVSPLGVHESLHVSDFKLPDGVVAKTDAGVTLCTVVIIAEEVAAPVAAAAAGAVPAEPELVGQKGKKEEAAEGGEKKAEAAAPKAEKK